MLPSTFQKILTDLNDEKTARDFLRSVWHDGIRFDEAKNLKDIDKLTPEAAVSLSQQAYPVLLLKKCPYYGRWLH
jgi:hypothetical protein